MSHGSIIWNLLHSGSKWETKDFNKKIARWIWKKIFTDRTGKFVPDLWRVCDNEMCGAVIHAVEVEDKNPLTKKKLQGYGTFAFELAEWDIDLILWRYDKWGNHTNRDRIAYSYLGDVGEQA